MAKLPLTVTEVRPAKGGLWSVRVAFADGSIGQYLVPTTMATLDGVRFSAVALGALADIATGMPEVTHGPKRRYDPRT